MELRCPECASPEVENDPQGGDDAHRCANCGACFPRECAFVTVLEAEAYRDKATPQRIFTFNQQRAAIELRSPDGALLPISPYSDADELHRLLDGAQAVQIIDSERPGACEKSRCRLQGTIQRAAFSAREGLARMAQDSVLVLLAPPDLEADDRPVVFPGACEHVLG
jgi:hypothetical protein